MNDEELASALNRLASLTSTVRTRAEEAAREQRSGGSLESRRKREAALAAKIARDAKRIEEALS